MLLAIDLYENLVDENGIAIAKVFSFQGAGINRTEFDTPESNCFAGDRYATFG